MLEALSNALVLLCIIALGYLLKQRGVLGPQHRGLFLTLVLNVTMPCAIIAGFDTRLNIIELIAPFLIACAACALLNLAAIRLTRGKPGDVRALTLLMTCGFLIAPFSIPFVQASMPSAFMAMAAFDVAQSLFNMGTNLALATALAAGTRAASHFSPRALLRNVLRSAPLVTYCALLLLRALHWQLPAIALNFCGKVGGANVFLSMVFIGMALDLRLDRGALRQLGRIFAIRYGVALGVGLLCFFALPIRRAYAQAITLGLLAPISYASMAYSEALGCDSKVYAAASSISFVVGIAGYAALLMLWG
jgi:predicted permease